MSTTTLISAMTDRIIQQFQPLQIILFGSHARNDATWDSDVDLLVVLPEAPDKHRAIVSILSALSDFPIGKDIIVTTPDEISRRGNLGGTILQPALREGKVLYQRYVSCNYPREPTTAT